VAWKRLKSMSDVKNVVNELKRMCRDITGYIAKDVKETAAMTKDIVE